MSLKPMNRDTPDDDFVTGYMCLIDFECELGAASGGNVVYPSLENLKENHTCWESCGVVEVQVKYVKTIVEQNFDLEKEDDNEVR